MSDARINVTSDLVTGDTVANFAIYRQWLAAQGSRLADYRSEWVGWGQDSLLQAQGETLFNAATSEYVLDSVQHGDVWLSGSGTLNGRTPRGVRWEVVEWKQNVSVPNGATLDLDTFEALLNIALQACPVVYGVHS